MSGVSSASDIGHTAPLGDSPNELGHGPDRRARQRANRTAELLEAALRVIRRQGAATSMAQIAIEAGITRPILYRHFGDVGGLYQAVADRFTGELFGEASAAADGAAGRDLVRAQIDRYLAFLERDPNLYRFLTRQIPLERPDARDAIGGFVQQLGQGVADFLHQAGMPAPNAGVIGRTFVGAIHTTSDWWLEDPQLTREALTEQLTDLLWSGISNAVTPHPDESGTT